MPETITSAHSAASAISTWPRKPSPKLAHRIGNGLSMERGWLKGFFSHPCQALFPKLTCTHEIHPAFLGSPVTMPFHPERPS